jgi:hypothetical protein
MRCTNAFSNDFDRGLRIVSSGRVEFKNERLLNASLKMRQLSLLEEEFLSGAPMIPMRFLSSVSFLLVCFDGEVVGRSGEQPA